VENKRYVNSGFYDVLHVAVGDNGCRDSSGIRLVLYDNPVASFASDQLSQCERGHEFVITATSVFAQQAGQHYWQVPDQSILDSGQVLVRTMDRFGRFPFALISSDIQGCSDTTTGVMEVFPQTRIAFITDTVCDGFLSTMKDRSLIDLGVITLREWLLGDMSVYTGVSPTHRFSGPGTYDVRLITTTDEGCKDTLVQARASMVRSLPTADFAFEKVFDSMTHTGYQFVSNSIGNTTLDHFWTFDRFGFSGVTNPYHVFPDTGRMEVALMVRDTFGCEGDITRSFATYPASEPYIPNAFSPNKDGLNEVFNMRGVAYTKRFNMQIFNRWGELLFESQDIEQGWDGTYQGQAVPPGTYVYKIQYVDLNGRSMQKFGDLTLLR
jgi:gliding motility-associated-like protein